MQVQQRLEEIQTLGARVAVVSFVTPQRLRGYLRERSWEFPVFCDPERSVYRAFGLGSASWSKLFDRRAMASYARLMLRGRRPRAAQEDVHQLGGDFVLDASGEIVLAHRSEHPADRPSVDALLKALKQAPASASGSP